jgi:glycosyltransferase involved in cell wall biosynthesis
MQNKPNAKSLAIIPAYNECERIGKVVSKIREAAEDLDVLVIDDGSLDKTSLCARDAGAKVVRLSSNMGYGVALQTGFKYAYEKDYDFLVQLDGDGQHNPAYIPDMLNVVISGQADLVLGSRFLNNTAPEENAMLPYKGSKIRKLGIDLFASLTTKLIGFKITDPTSGYQALNKRVIAFFTQDFFPCDFPDADVIVILHKAGFIIKEFPMIMSQRENGRSMHSGIKPVYYVFKMFLSMFMTLLRKTPTPLY